MWQPSRMVIFGLVIVGIGVISSGIIIQRDRNQLNTSSAQNDQSKTIEQLIFPIGSDGDYDIWRGFDCLDTFTGHRSDACPDSRPNLHTGLDILAEVGTPVVSVSGGTVIFAGPYTSDLQDCQSVNVAPAGVAMPDNDYGLQVIVQDGEYIYIYLHLSGLHTTVGAEFETGGEIIGFVGSRGCGSVPHLHFEVQFQGQPIDPIPHLAELNTR